MRFSNMFKKRIGITQRIIKHTRHNEVMDCLDINWAKILIAIDILPVPLPLLPSDVVVSAWKTLDLDGLILSGGNTLVEYADENDAIDNLSSERDNYERALVQAALSTGTPIMGVCRGLQLLNVYYKGHLTKIKGHVGTRHPIIPENVSFGFNFRKEVNSFHEYAIKRENLGKQLISLAYDAEDNVEAIYNPEDKVFGIMWHPEREKNSLQFDCELIKRHFDL